MLTDNRTATASIFSLLKTAVFFLACTFPTLSANASDTIAVVIDDSKGMCGYLADPNSEYHQLLNRLQIAVESARVRGAAVELHLLSQLSSGGSPKRNGSAIATLEGIDKGACKFTFGTSPLHLMRGVAGAKLTLLVSDMVFDVGQNGGATSRVQFVDDLAEWTRNLESKGPDKYFNASSGLIGFQSTFKGLYYTQQGSRAHNFRESVIRPFYVFWKSSDNEFSGPILKQLVKKDKTAELSSFSLSFTPYLGLTSGFEFRRPAYAVDLLKRSANATIFYEYSNRKTRYLAEQSNKIVPRNCFTYDFSAKEKFIRFDGRCGSNDMRSDFNFKAVDGLKRALLIVPSDDADSISRSLSTGRSLEPTDFKIRFESLGVGPLTMQADLIDADPKSGSASKKLEKVLNFSAGRNECKHFLECLMPARAAIEIGKRGGRVMVIELPRDSAFLKVGKSDVPRSSTWTDKFEDSASEPSIEILERIGATWGSDLEPCEKPVQCKEKGFHQTVGLAVFIKSLASFDSSKIVARLMQAGAAQNTLKLSIMREN